MRQALRRSADWFGYITLVAQVLLVAIRPSHFQWDFRTYYFASKLMFADSDPYDTQQLARALQAGGLNDGKVMPFIYPPHALIEFAPLTVVSFSVAYFVFLAVKVIALGAIIAFGLSWLKGWWRSFWPLLVSLMFGGAVGADLRSGNIGLIEAALVLIGIVALIHSRPKTFGGLIALAASIKTALLPLAALSLTSKARGRIIGALLPVAIIGTVTTLDYLIRPDLWAKFVATSEGLSEDLQVGSIRGFENSSSLRMISDVSFLTFGRFEAGFVGIAYIAVAIGVFAATVTVLRHNPRLAVLPCCMYGLLAYALIVPRLTSYSMVLLLAPAVYVMSRYMRHASAVALAIFSCIPFFYIGRLIGRSDQQPATSLFLLPFEYSNLLVVAICWMVMTYVLICKKRTLNKLSLDDCATVRPLVMGD